MKIVYNKITGNEVIAYEDPKVAGRYALPANSTEMPPPDFDASTHTCSFDGSQWVTTAIPEPEPEPEPEPIPAMEQLRIQRNQILLGTDWWVLPDRTATQAQLDYRQALRDLPQNSSPELDENGNLINVKWPEEPQ